jgi:hypothetical protein
VVVLEVVPGEVVVAPEPSMLGVTEASRIVGLVLRCP